jgi:Holliday junction resolvase-like predicted endonuclease
VPSTPSSVKASIRSQRWYALGFLCVGIGFLAVFASLGRAHVHGLIGLWPAACGLGLLAFARHQLQVVDRREHGIHVEAAAIEQACAALRKYGLSASPNVRFRGRGDIDLVVGHERHQMPVEIKSFQSWGGPNVARCREALEQVSHAQQFLHARRAYVWLPHATVGFWLRWRGLREGDVTVVFGHARHLGRIITRQAKV